MKPETPANTSDKPHVVRRKELISDFDIWCIGTDTQWLPVRSVLVTDSPRLDGVDVEHTRMLAGIDARLPPIIVHNASMRIIDGAHRLGAALLRGDDTIEARLFDGSEHEAFLLAVKANITHGLPLSLGDRMAAAERIIGSHPAWSDRAIAEATGLGARTVGGIRRRAGAENGAGVRMGRDGRVRPLDSTMGRLRASEIIKSRPNASLREIAKDAGVSPTTAGDVRDRIRRGEDPACSVRRAQRRGTAPAPEPRNGRPAPVPMNGRPTTATNITTMLQGLKNDPSLRLTESGRALLRWVISRAIQPEERHRVVENVPPHSTYVVAALARRCAQEWLQLAEDLETRTCQMA